ncbi:sulfurtransferase [Haloplanus aerogenes]|uniref:Sulfurtransferase n=1 Tax=Haloplanus aerogenes TaxID=660522 RepID=A0A3M0D0K9_9EURY|nr:sulfurtransferase [Haloplanus aerogenes]AZH24056.1 sulfurtransferase [Haloplanus aerogenes]RMB13169.1 thiosulfate/3-mercaptopyruvate sulfurtransferase [Haloplanus aerogenes]
MTEDIVVSIDWLADRLDEVRVVDVRDAWEFDGIGHVPGAVNVPFDRFRSSEGDEGMLPGADRWTALMEDAGIAPDDCIVAYDDEHGVFAARFLVTALLYGHDDVHLLNGDFSAWSRSHETTTDAPSVEPSTYEVREPTASPLVDFETVRDALDTDAVIVDTREAWEYEEGHLPEAVQLDWRELVDQETRGLKPDDELEAHLSDRGITPDRRIVLYCNTARRISHTYVALKHLGYDTVDFYEGSLTEWKERGGPLVEGDAADDA